MKKIAVINNYFTYVYTFSYIFFIREKIWIINNFRGLIFSASTIPRMCFIKVEFDTEFLSACKGAGLTNYSDFATLDLCPRTHIVIMRDVLI